MQFKSTIISPSEPTKKKNEYLDKINRDQRHLEEVKKNQDVGSGNNSNLFSLIFEFRLSPERFTN